MNTFPSLAEPVLLHDRESEWFILTSQGVRETNHMPLPNQAYFLALRIARKGKMFLRTAFRLHYLKYMY